MPFDREYFDAGLNRNGTRCDKWDVIRKEHGSDILPMWVADMDFPSPPAVQEALLKRAAHPTYGYTEAFEEDWQAVTDFWQRRHGLTLTKEEITMLPCVVTGLNVCVQALTQPGDEIIIQPPVYGPFYRAVTASGRKLALNPLLRDKTGRYHMDLDHLETLLQKGARMMLLCSPHNPVSRCWSRKELDALLSLLRRYDAILVADEIHADFVFKPGVFTPMLTLSHAEDKVLSLTAPSKTFNTAGLQQAYCFTRHKAMKEKAESFMQAAGVRCGNLFALEGSRAALMHGDEWLNGLLAYLDEGRRMLEEAVTQLLPKAVLTPLEATYLAWLDLRAYGLSTQELMERTHRAGVAFTGGTFFGEAEGEGFLRINIGCPHQNILEGIRRLQKALSL